MCIFVGGSTQKGSLKVCSNIHTCTRTHTWETVDWIETLPIQRFKDSSGTEPIRTQFLLTLKLT